MTIADITTATPAEIDTVLAELDFARWSAFMSAVQYRKSAYDAQQGSRWAKPDQDKADRLMTLAGEQDAIAAAKAEEMAPLNAEFTRRGGWTRAFLVVTNGTGHVHTSQACHTCYATTQFNWMTSFSGKDEAEIVEAAGDRACTVCYPSAPVEVLSRPTQMFTKDEVAKQVAREAREAKRAEAAKAQVIDVETGKVLFKTERGATNEVASLLDSAIWYGPTHPSYNKWIALLDRVSAALGARQGRPAAEVRAELVAKAEKKAKATLGGSKGGY